MNVRYIFAAVFIIIALLHIIAPQLLWRTGTAWQYKHPAANEPSKAGYMAQRIGGVIVLLFGLIIIFGKH